MTCQGDASAAGRRVVSCGRCPDLLPLGSGSTSILMFLELHDPLWEKPEALLGSCTGPLLIALKGRGSVWGDLQLQVPGLPRGFHQGGHSHCAAVTETGDVWAWGSARSSLKHRAHGALSSVPNISPQLSNGVDRSESTRKSPPPPTCPRTYREYTRHTTLEHTSGHFPSKQWKDAQ